MHWTLWKNQFRIYQYITRATKEVSFKSNLDFFHQKNPPLNYGDDNISPYKTKTFTACKSMQNIQCLSVSGGLCKYCCKYVGNIDKKNYCKVSKYDDGRLIRYACFCTIPNMLLLIKSNKQNKRRNETGNIDKGQ